MFIIDGVDEKTFDFQTQLEKINYIIGQAKDIDTYKLLFATRPLGFLEGKNSFDIVVNKYELKPLSISHVLDFFKTFCSKAGISSRILEDIKKSQIFKQLPKSPIATILLANLINENGQDLPSNLTELYSKYLELMLGRWDIKKGLNSEKEYEAAKSVICNIARYFIENDLQQISKQECFEFFTDFLNKRNLGLEAKTLFLRTLERSGILCINRENDSVYFKHRTFCEYLFASGALNNKFKISIDNKIFNYYWRNIYFFYIGLLKDCEETLNEMLNVNPESDIERFLRTIYMSDYLLAGYASPYFVVEKALPKIFCEAADLQEHILAKKIDTPMSKMSPVELLWFFQAILRTQPLWTKSP